MSDAALPVVGEIELPESRIKSVDWSPDGTRMVVGTEAGVAVVSREGGTLWSRFDRRTGNCFAKWSPDGRWIAFSRWRIRGVLSAVDGTPSWEKPTRGWGRKVEIDPQGAEIAFAAEGRKDLWLDRAASGEQVSDLSDPVMLSWSLAYSLDNRLLAVGRRYRGQARIDLIDRLTSRVLRSTTQEGENHWGQVHGLEWSPDGDRLACAILVAPGAQRCLILDCGSLEVEEEITFGGKGVWSLAWARRGDLIAIGSRAGGVEVFRGIDAGRLARYTMSGNADASVAFSADGRQLAVACGSSIRILDTSSLWRQLGALGLGAPLRGYAARQAATVGRRPADLSMPADDPLGAASARWDRLLALTTALHGLDLTPPLSLLVELDGLLAGRVSEAVPADLGAHAGIERLRGLRWPPESRAGLLALLLRKLPLDSWRPPAGTGSRDLRAVLVEALAGDEIAPRPEPFPGVLLRQAADALGSRLVTLLEILGPQAVRDDPGLALRLLTKAALLPPFARAQRRLLTEGVMSDEQGRAERRIAGGGLSGIRRRGRPEALLPSQLALPPGVLALRHLRGDLLYRAHSGGELPRFRPTVIVLDVSPPTFGPVEKVTRPAAMLVGRTLLEAGLPAILVTAGGQSRFHVLDRRSRLLSCWTERSLEPVRLAEALRAAEALRETLRGGPLEPVVLVLSHAGFADEGDRRSPLSPRALLVRYPGQRAKVTREHRWSRLAMVDAGASAQLPGLLRGLIA